MKSPSTQRVIQRVNRFLCLFISLCALAIMLNKPAPAASAQESPPQTATLWLGNNAQTTDRDAFQSDTTGAVLRTLNNTLLSGVAFDGEFLYFGTLYGAIEKRTADGATVLDSFTLPGLATFPVSGGRTDACCHDLAWDSQRQRLWRIEHGGWLEKIHPQSRTREAHYAMPTTVDGSNIQRLAGLGVAYDAGRDLLYVSFCEYGCARFDEGLVLLIDPDTGSVIGTLFRTDGFATGGLGYDSQTDTLWVGSKTAIGSPVTVINMSRDGEQLSIFTSPVTSSGFADGLEFVSPLPSLPTARLVKDINPFTDGALANADKLMDVNGIAFFVAWDDARGYELWKSDGTATGTQLVKDICPGDCDAQIKSMTAVGATLFFRAYTPETGHELWKSDGTAAGTQLVTEIVPGSSDGHPEYLAAMGGFLYFGAYDPVSNSQALWKSDGTAGGTVVVKPNVNLAYLTAAGSTLYFSGHDSAGHELWKSDGTAAGTVLVKDLFPGASSGNPEQFTPAGALLYFVAEDALDDRELWVSDGTATGTKQVKEIRSGNLGSYPEELTALGTKVFFVADNGTLGREVWVSDGTAAGTFVTKNIYAGVTSSNPSELTAANGLLFFVASDTIDTELWKSDGTTSGTSKLNLSAGSASTSPFELRTVNNTLFFGGYDPTVGYTIWKSDGTVAGSTRLSTQNVPPHGAATIGTNYYFFNGGIGGDGELWKSDGTVPGTGLITQFYPAAGDSDIQHPIEWNDSLFFAANDGLNGTLLWTSNGTTAGTYPVSNSVIPLGRIIVFANKLFFPGGATTGSGDRELWQSNGTAGGTTLVKNLFGGGSSEPEGLTVAGNKFYFTAYDSTAGRELWVSDGTAAGTVRVKNIRAGADDSAPEFLTAVGTKLFFTADNGTHGRELWVSDGSAAGTVMVKNLTDGVGSTTFTELIALGNLLYFVAYEPTNSGYSLWQSDGTAAGTTIVPNTASRNPSDLAALNGKLYFNATDPTLGSELWVSDGTAAGAQVLVDLDPLTQASPSSLVTAGNRIFFLATTSAALHELWVTDGTTVGTRFVKDIYRGTAFGSDIQEMVAVGDKLFFQANDGVHGREWWMSDGTPTGTQVINTFPGSGSSFAARIAKAGSRVYAYALGDLAVGYELYAYDLAPATAPADLSLTLSDAPDPLLAGNAVTYQLLVNNAGPNPAPAVVVTNTLPTGVTFLAATPACTHTAGMVTCAIGTLAAAANSLVTITVQTTTPGLLTNSATVGSATDDPNLGNNSDSETTTVNPAATITILHDAVPNSATNFRFTGGVGSFYLDDVTPQDADAYQNSRSFLVAPGAYTITEVPPTTWFLADITCTPAANGTVTLALKRVTITVAADDHVTCTFTNHLRVNINTLIFHDLDQDRRYDVGEPGLPNWTVRIYDAANTELFAKTTDTNGAANFTRLLAPNVTYKVCEEVEAGWTRSVPSRLDPTLGKPCYTRTPTPGQTLRLRFGNKPLLVGASDVEEELDVVEDVTVEEAPALAPDESGYDAGYVEEEIPLSNEPVNEAPVMEQPVTEQPVSNMPEMARSLFLPLIMQE
jgi:uncharacterized repeat protein (TIGR01451 family)